MPMKPVGLLLSAIITLLAGLRVADAADPRYPDWPCVQAKVPDLSIAAVWDGPSIEPAQKAWQDDPTIKNLIARLAARRIAIEEAQKSVEDFLAGAGAAKTDKGVLLFAGLFETLNRERTEIMNGLERMQRSQRELADRIKPSSMNSGRGSNGARAFSTTGGNPSDMRAKCRSLSNAACLRSAGRSGSRWSRTTYSPTAGAGCASTTGNSASVHPSVPSGYHATLV